MEQSQLVAVSGCRFDGLPLVAPVGDGLLEVVVLDELVLLLASSVVLVGYLLALAPFLGHLSVPLRSSVACSGFARGRQHHCRHRGPL